MNTLIFTMLCWLYAKARFGITSPSCSKDTFIIAHRGLTSRHLENTLCALVDSFLVGADGVEFDVQLTRDLVPVVFHDRDLRRLVGIRKNIDDLSSKKLMELRQRSNAYQTDYPISTLEEVLNSLPTHKFINVELKETTGMKGKKGIKEILKVLTPWQNKQTLVISSFDPNILTMVHDQDPRWSLGLLVDKNHVLQTLIKSFSILKYIDYINPHLYLLNKVNFPWIKNLGIQLILWGHAKKGQEGYLLKEQPTGLITDFVEDLLTTRKRHLIDGAV